MKVLTDEVEEHPVLGFEPYAECIVDIIRDTNPRFSIGIYGEWGTGKTTLMEAVRKKLTDNKGEVLTVWFNAWRYEREEHFAIVALMKTIAYEMADHSIYKEIKPVVIRSLKIIAKGLVQGLAAKALGEKTLENLKEDDILPYVEFLTKFDKDTIYFDGIHNIEEEMKSILTKYPNSRIVVFIDDLDRCSPKRALEVFESIKVFLDIKGFIFVIGLSHETIAKLISAEYQASGIKGEEYIRKIIQIPIILPSWNQFDVKDIINNLLDRGDVDRTYSQIIVNNKDLIAAVVEPVPREVKRFINSFLISYKIYSNRHTIKPRELLLIQAIKFRWYDFYKSFSSDEGFRNLIKEVVEFDFSMVSLILVDDKEFERYESEIKEIIKNEERAAVERKKPKSTILRKLENWDRIPEFETKNIEDKVIVRYKSLRETAKKITRKYKAISMLDSELWSLLRNEKDIIFNIRDWDIYRRASEISKEIPLQKVSGNFTARYDIEGSRPADSNSNSG